MRISGIILVWFGLGLSAAETVDFDLAKTGEIPPGWSAAITHKGPAPRWVVHPDVTAPSRPNVLAQVSTNPSKYRFPLLIFDKVTFKNADLSVKMKLVSGKDEQTAGLMWRYQDPNNYYFVRANAQDDNIVMFKLENGKATPIAPVGTKPDTFGVRHMIEKGEWNILKVVIRDDRFTVYFDHRKVFEGRDRTFQQPGKAGLWTKADTIAYFDDFRLDRKN